MEVAAGDVGETEVRDYDEITAFLGDWGPFQRLMFVLLSVSIFPNGFTGLSIVFVGDVPEHHCSIPGNLNLSEAWMNRTIPLVQGDDPHYSKCSRYRLDVIMNLSETFPHPDFINMSGVEQEPCLDGWEYSREQYISTIVSEWHLVCNNNWKSPFSMSIFFAGVLVGSFISGQLSDKFGRKIILFGSMAVQGVFGILQVFSPNWEIFCFLNFFLGLGRTSKYIAAFVLGNELPGKSVRIMFCTLGAGISYAIGYMLLPLFAYFIRSWRMLLLALSVSGLLYIPLWWFIPESPRWLMLNGKSKEAEEILRYIAKKNGVLAPDVLFSDLELEDMKTKSTQSHNTIIHLVKTSNIRIITIINMLLWMIINIGYYGLSLNTPNLHGNDYLNCFFSAAIEVPSYIASWLFLRRFSRRFTLSSILLLAGVVLLFIQLIPSDILILTTVLAMTGKLATTCAFAMIYVYTAEVFPTAVRNTGMGVSSMAARVGSIISPYIFYLGVYHEILPYTLLGSFTALSGILMLLLPETFNHPLPDTIEQMQNIKRMIITIGYYGLSLNIPNLHGNDYLNCFFSAAIEVPGYIASWFFLWKFSRRFTHSSTLLLAGAVLLLIQFIPSGFLMEVAAGDTGETEVRDYDEITAFLGDWGPFQKLMFVLLSLSVFPNGFTGLSIVFIGDVPEHHCSIPGNLNLSEAWMNRTIPLVQGDDPHYSKCSRYRLDVIMNLSETFPHPDFINMSGVEQEPCLDGWEYSREQYISTIVSEWDLVCNDVWKSPFSMSILFAGVLVGSFISGQLSDKFGRKAILFGTMAVQGVFSILQVFSPNWETFCLLNFLVGLGKTSKYMAAFVLGMELLGKSVRIMFCTLGVCISYATGYMLLSLFAYFIRSWRMLLLALSVSSLLYIPLWWFIPESPRWLMLNGRSKKAEEIFRYIAKKNGVMAPDVLFSDLELEDMKAKSTQSHTIIHLVKTNNIRVITIINMLLWMIITIGYYGLSLNTPNLHGDKYLNCFLSAAIEVPAYIASWIFLWRLPRRLALSSTLLLAGAVLLLIQFIPSDISGLATVLVMTGKLATTCGFSMIIVYSSELYPTAVRNMGIGVSSMVCRFGSILSPYIFYLGVYHEILPYTLLGSFTALSGILVLLLPETFNHPLPDTIEQMQNIKRFNYRGLPEKHFNIYKRNLNIVVKEERKIKPAAKLQQNKNG